MDKTKYFVVKKKALPEVLIKVVEAKRLLASERGLTIQEATIRLELAGVLFINTKTIFSRFMKMKKGRRLPWWCRWMTHQGFLLKF